MNFAFLKSKKVQKMGIFGIVLASIFGFVNCAKIVLKHNVIKITNSLLILFRSIFYRF